MVQDITGESYAWFSYYFYKKYPTFTSIILILNLPPFDVDFQLSNSHGDHAAFPKFFFGMALFSSDG